MVTHLAAVHAFVPLKRATYVAKPIESGVATVSEDQDAEEALWGQESVVFSASAKRATYRLHLLSLRHRVGCSPRAHNPEQVKAALRIPVLANGNVRTLEDAQRLMAETGADGVLSADPLLVNPALFRWGRNHNRAVLRPTQTIPVTAHPRGERRSERKVNAIRYPVHALKGEPLARETASKADEDDLSLDPITLPQLLGLRHRRSQRSVSLAQNTHMYTRRRVLARTLRRVSCARASLDRFLCAFSRAPLKKSLHGVVCFRDGTTRRGTNLPHG